MNQENGFSNSWSPNQPSWNMTNSLSFDIQSSADSTKGNSSLTGSELVEVYEG